MPLCTVTAEPYPSAGEAVGFTFPVTPTIAVGAPGEFAVIVSPSTN